MRTHPVTAGWLWIGVLGVATVGLLMLRDHLDKAHVVLAYLLVVLGGSANASRAVGLLLAILSFLCFNFFFLPPYNTLVIKDPLDWLVLVAFLVTSVVATQLLYRAQHGMAVARQRAEEIDRLSALGAETLNAGRAEEAVQAVAHLIQSTLPIGACEVHQFDNAHGTFRRIARAARADYDPAEDSRMEELFPYVLQHGVVAVERAGGATHTSTDRGISLGEAFLSYPDARLLLFPLRLQNRVVGILQFMDRDAIRLEAPQRRFAEALAYYVALGVERVRLEAEAQHAEALRQADRLKDALLASVSHDLRTPLTTIKALAHDMRAGGDERAATIEEESDRLNQFVSSLLDLSRLKSGTLTLTPGLIAADDLLGAAVRQATGVLGERELRTSLPSGIHLLVGYFDMSHSLRALVNLIDNACKYSPPGAPVEVVIRGEGDRIAFDVLDRGPGVPEAERHRIFEPFYRATRAGEGTGLGLAIARGLAEAQEGAIEYSPREDGGSRFTLLLPAADLETSEMS